MKIFFRRIHLYLGLSAGLVILVCCLTGALLVFEKDLMMATNKQRYYVDEWPVKISADQLVKKVKDSFQGAKINSVKIYEDPKRSAEINITIAPKKEQSNNAAANIRSAAPQRQPGYTIFINP